MSVRIIEPPVGAPVSVPDFRAHANITLTGDDTLIADKIRTATQQLERFLGRAFIAQTLVATFDAFGHVLLLPRAPVQSITSISYRDSNWQSQPLPVDRYFAVALGTEQRPMIYPARGTSWPGTAELPGSVEVTFIAGYSDAPEDVPEPLREAIRMQAAHLYENREATLVGVSAMELPGGVHDLIRDYREWAF